MAHGSVSLLAISGADVMRIAEPRAVIHALAEGFKALSREMVQAPPRPKVDVPGKGYTLAMLAAAPAQHTAMKVVSVYDGNHAIGLASHQALVALFERDTGLPLAILDGASLTGLRTAAAAILTVREMARPDAKVATVIGGGVQAREHARYLSLVRDFSEIRVFARREDQACAVAEGIPNAHVVTDLEAAVATSDVVCLTTSSHAPVIEEVWVRPGTHVTSVGFTPPDSELPRALIARAAIFVESKNAFQPAPVGCAELAGMDPARGAEIGEVLLGLKPGRTSADQVTLYKSMGNAMEDMVVANLVYAEAKKRGLGTGVEV